MDAKAEILRRIAEAKVPAAPAARPGGTPTEGDILARFAEHVAEYRATVHRVSTAEIASAVGEILGRKGAGRLLVPKDLPASWRPAEVVVVEDHALAHEDLDACDSVLTGCALGVAETGTIVLDSGPGQGRRALTLIPDHHICVVHASQVVGSLEEAIARIRPSIDAHRPLTWISGPSATSDIELTRVEGVHGPRELEVLLVSEP